MRTTVLMACGTALIMGLLTAPANAASAPGMCPVAFGAPFTYEEILLTPQVVAALDAGVYDAAHVQLVFDIVDKNGDALICSKSFGNENQFMSVYARMNVDNNAAPK